MDEFGRVHHGHDLVPYGGDRSLEIVTGKVYSTDHPYGIRSLPPPPRRSTDPPPYYANYDLDVERWGGKRTGGGGGSAWCFSDPEMKRRKRVASYKVYSVEGKLKGKIRRGWRWIKSRCHELVHGYD